MRDAMAYPDVMPILSPPHRSPRRGACFMEFASSSRASAGATTPACTHGTLAPLARLVNDRTSDADRARLTPLIPTVIGLTSNDPLLDVLFTVRAAHAACPSPPRSASARRPWRCASPSPSSRNSTTSSSRSRRAGRGRPPRRPRRRRLGHPVHRGGRSGPPGMTVRQCRDIVTGSVDGIARACVGDADDRLVALLTAAVSDTARFVARCGSGGCPAEAMSLPRRMCPSPARALVAASIRTETIRHAPSRASGTSASTTTWTVTPGALQLPLRRLDKVHACAVIPQGRAGH